jgi:hypothetical protein
MKKPRDRFQSAFVCINCWRADRWKSLRDFYLSVIPQAILVLLPVMTAFMWLIYVLWWKDRPHWGDNKGFYLFLYLPTMMTVGVVPLVLSQLWLISRFEPKLELLSSFSRFFLDKLPVVLYGLTCFLALFLFIYIWDGKVVIK